VPHVRGNRLKVCLVDASVVDPTLLSCGSGSGLNSLCGPESCLSRYISVGDPDPQDPYVFGPPGSVRTRYGSGSGSFY
jgi:hypothetical protein